MLKDRWRQAATAAGLAAAIATEFSAAYGAQRSSDAAFAWHQQHEIQPTPAVKSATEAEAIAYLRSYEDQYRYDILLLTRVVEAQKKLGEVNALRAQQGQPPMTLPYRLCEDVPPLRRLCPILTASFGPPPSGTVADKPQGEQ